MEVVKVRVFGIEESYTLERLSAILEEYREMKGTTYYWSREKILIGTWFRVTPATINQKLFQEKREDRKQEEFRLRVLEVFESFKNYPERLRPFKTMVPYGNGSRNVQGLIEIAEKYGGHVAKWYEQELEWAQRISNGESWEEVCNKLGGPRQITYIVGTSQHYYVGLSNYHATYLGDPWSGDWLGGVEPIKPLVASYNV